MQQNYTIFIIAALILFGVFRRVRRNIGWQKLNSSKMLVRIAIFFVIGLIFLGEGALHPVSLFSDVIGIIIGSILAYYGAVMTRFEQRDGRWYYRPNTWIGSIVIVIFFGRLVYRLSGIFMLGNLNELQSGQMSDLQNMGYVNGNSWSSGLMLIMFAYYVLYYIILMRKQKQNNSQGNNKLSN